MITARSAGIVLFTHTLRLHKRFGNVTDFTDGSYSEAVERPANYFGKGTASDDDKALQALGRAAEDDQAVPELKDQAVPEIRAALLQSFRVSQARLKGPCEWFERLFPNA